MMVMWGGVEEKGTFYSPMIRSQSFSESFASPMSVRL